MLKVFKMKVICMYCGTFVRYEASYIPGTSHGVCDRCLKYQKSVIGFIRAFIKN